MTTDIFIRTYAGDAAWLEYSLRAVQKFCTGFSNLAVVCPEDSSDTIRPLADRYGANFATCPKLHTDDYIGQQATKMHADKWSDAEAICFVDSDVIFLGPATPGDLIDNGKISMLKTAYNTIDTPWQGVTEAAVGFQVEWEYMRRFPLTFPRELLPASRRHIEQTHGKDFDHFIRDIRGRHFSEFNVLGALSERLMPGAIDWRDTAQGNLPPLLSKQFWSWGGLNEEIKNQLETLLQ